MEFEVRQHVAVSNSYLSNDTILECLLRIKLYYIILHQIGGIDKPCAYVCIDYIKNHAIDLLIVRPVSLDLLLHWVCSPRLKLRRADDLVLLRFVEFASRSKPPGQSRTSPGNRRLAHISAVRRSPRSHKAHRQISKRRWRRCWEVRSQKICRLTAAVSPRGRTGRGIAIGWPICFRRGSKGSLRPRRRQRPRRTRIPFWRIASKRSPIDTRLWAPSKTSRFQSSRFRRIFAPNPPRATRSETTRRRLVRTIASTRPPYKMWRPRRQFPSLFRPSRRSKPSSQLT